MPSLENLFYGDILPAPQAYRPPQKCNVPQSASPLGPSQHAAPRCGLSSVCICPRVPQPRITGSLPPFPPAHHASALPPRQPAVYHQIAPAKATPVICCHSSPHSSSRQPWHPPHPPRSSCATPNASLSTAHPFLAQQQPLQHTLSCTPSSGPAFNIFSRLSLPLSSQQSLSSFTLWTRRRRAAEGEKKYISSGAAALQVIHS